MKLSHCLALSGFMTLFGACASVPKDAPEELQTADQSIKAANKIDADDYAPKTMKAAKSKLSSSVDLYKDSKDKNDAGKLEESKAQAKDATKMANNAVSLVSDVKAWDGSDLQAYADQKDASANLTKAQAEINELKNQPAPVAAVAPAENINVVATAAFFPTGEAKVEDNMSPELSHLVELMTANPNATVKLTGRADHRGGDAFNATLSESRAQAVANFLEGKGIAASRITTEGVGRDGAADVADPGRLQLDRRVDAQINTMAH